MIIQAYGRWWIEDSTYKNLKETCMNHILISITGDEKYKVDLQHVKNCNFCKAISTNYFEDITLEIYDSCDRVKETCILFKDHHAENILEFVDKHINNVSSIIVHCDAGVSRSVGIAAALSKILNSSDDEFFKGSPNKYVYAMMLNYYYKNESKFPNMVQYERKQHRLDVVEF